MLLAGGAACSSYSHAVVASPRFTPRHESSERPEALEGAHLLIVCLRGLTTDHGIPLDGIVSAVNGDTTSVEVAVKELAGWGFVEASSAGLWRLVPIFRGTVNLYIRVAGLIRAGEWTTYGDVALAATGSGNGSQAVGRAAASIPSFPNPHRILQKGGRIPGSWRNFSGDGRDQCMAMLVAEGVAFDAAGLADSGAYVAPERLRERWDEDPLAVGPPELNRSGVPRPGQ